MKSCFLVVTTLAGTVAGTYFLTTLSLAFYGPLYGGLIGAVGVVLLGYFAGKTICHFMDN